MLEGLDIEVKIISSPSEYCTFYYDEREPVETRNVKYKMLPIDLEAE